MARTRAERRHHRVRIKKTRKNYFNTGIQSPRNIGIVYQTPCTCSCWMCGHRRYYDGYGMQELKARKARRIRKTSVLRYQKTLLDPMVHDLM